MSGSDGPPRVHLVGQETRRVVEAIEVVAQSSDATPTIVGGLAVLCRDVIEVAQRSDSRQIEDPTDRLYEMAHAWAYRTATEVEIVADAGDGSSVRALARVAEPGPLVAMKLQAVLLRSTAKEGTDLLDIVTVVLDPTARESALRQLARCDPVIAQDAALHSRRWFVEQTDRTLRLISAAGGIGIGRDEVELVAVLLDAATRRA